MIITVQGGPKDGAYVLAKDAERWIEGRVGYVLSIGGEEEPTIVYDEKIVAMHQRVDREYVLADLATLKVNGPAVLFIRPRRELSAVEKLIVGDSNAILAQHTGMKVWTVPHDFDILCVGEAELERIGWTKLPVTKTTVLIACRHCLVRDGKHEVGCENAVTP